MEKKLSDALASLKAKAKSIEDKAAAASQESKDKLDKRIADTKAQLQAQKDKFVNDANAANAKAKDGWDAFKSSVDQKVAQVKTSLSGKKAEIKTKIDEKKHDWNVASAEVQYNNSLDYAEYCVEWASIALSDAEEAILEAISAQLELTSLQEN